MEKEMFSRYQHYTEHDFIADPWFSHWVLRPDEDSKQFWEAFFAKYPNKAEEATVASRFLKNLSFREDFPDEERVKAALAKHLQQVQHFEETPVIEMPRRKKRVALLWLAACMAGLAVVASVILLSNGKNTVPLQVAQTGYSQLQNVTLPDGSQVVLNASSSLQYANNWSAGEKREVWLSGEAYFDVKHLNRDTANIKESERFLVYTNGITIEVLGTSFDIRNRRGKTEVVLEKGKIKLSFANNTHADVVMQPGDIITYDSAENHMEASRTNADNYIAWTEKKLILTDPTVSQIVAYLEDNFGYKIQIEGAGLAEKKIEGPILLTNLDDALFVLSAVLNTNVIRNDDSTIILRAK